jgi:hypothetical protein
MIAKINTSALLPALNNPNVSITAASPVMVLCLTQASQHHAPVFLPHMQGCLCYSKLHLKDL